MGILVNVAKWECPLCHKHGRLWLNSWKARKFGRRHIRMYHKDYKLEPILKILKKEEIPDGKQ